MALFDLLNQQSNVDGIRRAGAAMRQQLQAAGYPVPDAPIPFEQMQQIYNQYVSETRQNEINKQTAEARQKEAINTAGDQGKTLLNASGLGDPRLDVIREQLFNSGGVKKANELQYRTGVQLQQPNALPLSDAKYSEVLTAQDKPEKPDTNLSGDDLIARELGLKGAYEATPEQAAKINQLKQERGIKAAEDKANNAAEARYKNEIEKLKQKQTLKLNETLSVDEAIKLGVPYGTTRAGAIGKQPLTSQQRETLNEFSSAEAIIDDLADVSSRVNTWKPGPLGLGRLAGAAVNTWGALTQTNEDAAIMDSKVGELSLLVRAMGEKGTLATKDVDRVAKLVPTKTDTIDVAKRKIKELHEFIASVKDKRIQSFIKDINNSTAPAAPAAPKTKPPSEMSNEELMKELNK